MIVKHYVFEPCTVTDVEGNKLELPRGTATVSYAEGAESVIVGFEPRFLQGQRQSITITQSELLRLIRSGLGKLK